ncbi:hypothetical protein BS78_K234500 [Paspalum vaginatum]|uniref:Uncharacterized protein n=1 Tax=Paspalum vaginatum TaxID=158149 RepID=A0A9W7X7N5_9POAL|nr:hypothetical protein BS78_K234500 [Paspalum vaginatum]
MREALCGGAVGPPKSSHATSMCHQPLASIPRLASWPPSFLPLVLYNQTIHIQSGGDRRLGSLSVFALASNWEFMFQIAGHLVTSRNLLFYPHTLIW